MLQSIGVVLFLVFLEISLSMDNAIVLALLVQPLDQQNRQRALCYGMWGAFLFRIIAVFSLGFLFTFWWLKLIAAGYLIYLCASHFMGGTEDEQTPQKIVRSFWKTILAVELTDIAFSADSIFAGVAACDNVMLVILGGILGIIFMRFVAFEATKILDKFPWLGHVAYGLIGLIGFKLFIFR